MKAVLAILALGIVISLSLAFEEANATLTGNNAFLLEGSGFAVTDDSIKTTQVDFLFATGVQTGSRANITVEDGFVTLNEDDFVVTDLSGTVLREGRFLRLLGTVENSGGEEASLSIFGRLIQNSDAGSVYTLTGRLNEDNESHRIIYTTKISELRETPTSSAVQTTTSQKQMKENEIQVRILKDSSIIGIASNYIEALDDEERKSAVDIVRARYYYPERLTISPGITLTFVNNDDVSHSISSGKRDTNSQGISPAIPDGRISSGEIKPGNSWSITINDIGFIHLFDIDYPWMTIDVVSFPDTESDVIRKTGRNQAGN